MWTARSARRFVLIILKIDRRTRQVPSTSSISADGTCRGNLSPVKVGSVRFVMQSPCCNSVDVYSKNECFAKYGMCMVCSFVPFRSREHDENTLRTAHPAVIFASHMCLVCGWVWVLDMNTRQQYMKPFYTGTLDINRSQTVPDPGTIGAVPDSIISTNTIHAHHPACKVLQLHLPCTNPAFMQMECIVKT